MQKAYQSAAALEFDDRWRRLDSAHQNSFAAERHSALTSRLSPLPFHRAEAIDSGDDEFLLGDFMALSNGGLSMSGAGARQKIAPHRKERAEAECGITTGRVLEAY
jgi:hypothetical protein